MKNNKKLWLIVLCIFMCSLTGCVKEYEQKDIEKYVRDECDLMDFTVSKDYVLVEDSQGHEDYIWTVRMNDEPKLEFRVKDDYGLDMESVSNYLWDDYEEVMLAYLYENYDGTMTALKFVTEDKESMLWSGFEGTYQNREQLRSLFLDMQEFYAYIESTGYQISAYATFQLEHPLRHQVETEIDDGDYRRRYEKALTEEDLLEAEKEYLLTCLDYRLEKQLADFTQEEIEAVVDEYSYGVYIEREDGMAERYADLCANKYAYGISFGTIYEILVREGIKVEGDSHHYSFVNENGNAYEISYDFCDYPYENQDGETTYGYYYIKDGKKVPMRFFFYNHFSEKEAQEITGLTLHINR